MNNRALWNWTIILTAVLAVLGAIVARLMQATLSSETINVVVAIFFMLCVLVMGGLVAIFTLRRR